jgi:hypothetical protein
VDLWERPVDTPVGYGHAARFQVIVGVSGYSRFTVACMIPTKETCDLLAGHLSCLIDLGGVPRKGVYDNEDHGRDVERLLSALPGGLDDAEGRSSVDRSARGARSTVCRDP